MYCINAILWLAYTCYLITGIKLNMYKDIKAYLFNDMMRTLLTAGGTKSTIAMQSSSSGEELVVVICQLDLVEDT